MTFETAKITALGLFMIPASIIAVVYAPMAVAAVDLGLRMLGL